MTSSAFTPRQPSRRSRIVAASATTFMRPITTRIPDSDVGVAAARGILAAGLSTLGRTAPGTTVEDVDDRSAGGRVRGEWVRAGTVSSDAVILYAHGSGYAACSARTHRGFVSRLSATTGLAAFSVDYRLAPEHRFPAAANDVAAAWQWLASRYDPSRIVVAGDSAGGHLAFDLALALVRVGAPAPAALALFSPLSDLTFDLAADRDRSMPDPMTSAAAARRLVGHYIASTDPAHPRLTHRVQPGEIMPPTLIQAGGAEMLAADAHHMHRQLVDSGSYCELEVWPGQMHVFQAMPRLIPEADPALRRAARFLTHHLAATAAESTPIEVGA